MAKSYGNTLFYSLIIIITAQLNMNLFITDFKISIACILFPAILFLVDSFPIISVTLCSAVGVFLTRILFYWFNHGTFDLAVAAYFPELTFYLIYGLLLCMLTKLIKNRSWNRNLLVLPLICIDYTANLCELLLRVQLNAFTVKTQTGIFLIALLRTLVVWCILAIFEQYRFLLLKKEHEERYRRLVLLISKLNGEIVWMKKNTSLIENTMNTSYKLYENLKTSDQDMALSKSALSIAKDIHEIKKEYLLIMRGISAALDEEFQSEGMYWNELLDLLKDSAGIFARELEKTLSIELFCPVNLYTDKHYALLSIFRNLLVNAIEAANTNDINIQLVQQIQEKHYVFEVTDNGPGILTENKEDIFKAGFSTKINYHTGEVNRGLGLNLVKDLTENQLGGRLSFTSVPGKTTFTISIPKENIEVIHP